MLVQQDDGKASALGNTRLRPIPERATDWPAEASKELVEVLRLLEDSLELVSKRLSTVSEQFVSAAPNLGTSDALHLSLYSAWLQLTTFLSLGWAAMGPSHCRMPSSYGQSPMLPGWSFSSACFS